MSHLDSQYTNTDYDRVTHSTPKKSRDNYGSAISSSYVPGQLSQSVGNHISELQGDNANIKTDVTRTVTQSVKKASSSSTRSSGYSSEDGHNDVLNSRINGPVDTSSTVGSYGLTSSSAEQRRLVDRPMPLNLGFEYEDINSFRERQKVEGDRLQTHRKSLTGNIVGTGKLNESATGDAGSYGDSSNVTSYSSRITSSSYRSSDEKNDPLSRENLLAEARARRNDSLGITSSSRDPVPSSYGSNRESALLSSRYTSGLSRSVEDILGSSSSRYSSSRDSALSPTRYSSALSNSREDIISSKGNSPLTRSTEDILSSSRPTDKASSRYSSEFFTSSKYKDPLSRESLLAEARSKDSALSSSRYSSGLSRSIEDILGSSRNRDPVPSYSSRYTSDLSTRLSSPTSGSESRSDALVAKYLQSSRHKNASKHTSDSDLDLKSRHSPLSGIKEEDDSKGTTTDVKHHSAGGKPMSYLPSSASYEDLLQKRRESEAEERTNRYSHGDLYSSRISPRPTEASENSKKLSTELKDERKARQSAIDRLLENTRRYTSDSSLLDYKSRDRYGSRDSERKPGERSPIGRYQRDDKELVDTRQSRGMSPDDRARLGITRGYSESSSYETPYTSLDHSYKPNRYQPGMDTDRIYDQPYKPTNRPDNVDGQHTEGNSYGVYDKLQRGIDTSSKPGQEPGYSGSRMDSKDNPDPLYDRLNSSASGVIPRRRDSPIPMSDKYSLPLDKYDRPIAVHGRSPDSYKPDDPRGREIVSRSPYSRNYDVDVYNTDRQEGVTETTRMSVTQRTFMSRDGKVLKDETKHHEELYHGGRNALDGPQRTESNHDQLPSRIQRYPPITSSDYSGQTPSTSTKDEPQSTPGDRPRDGSDKLDDILKRTGINLNDTNSTNYQEQTRKNEITRITDDSTARTRVHRTDVNTNVNIVKDIVKEKNERPAKSGIAGLRSKIEALTKSVDDLMNYKHKSLLRDYVTQHSDRRPSQDLELLPKPDYYEVKSKRYEPSVKLDEVDYVHKAVEIEKTPRRPDFHGEITVENMWITKEHQGPDIGIPIPNEISLIPEKKEGDWWNAGTAEAADRFLCIGDWQYWNASTTEGVDNILGIRAINRDTGAAGAIIAKYQGEENPIEWKWYEASQQPSRQEKRRTLTSAMKKDMKEKREWWDAPTTEDADKHLSIGHYKWWEEHKSDDVDQVLGVKGSTEETGTILATYTEGTKPSAWTWVQTEDTDNETVKEKHMVRRSSRNLYIDETDAGNVELLIRVKDEQTTEQQQPRYIAIRPGPVEKAIIIREIIEENIPDDANDVAIQGTAGEGLEVQDGVVKVRIKDMTVEERKAWMNIMGIEKKQFKLKENDFLEIPVKVVDRPQAREDLYAVPDKKKKKKHLNKTKSDEEEKQPTIHRYKGGILAKKTSSELKIKESDSVRKKREQKTKKQEEEEKKKQAEREKKEKENAKKQEKIQESLRKKAEKESIKKKKEMESIKKKKEQESIKKKKEEKAELLKKKKEAEKEKKESKKKKEQLSKKSSASSSKENKDAPPIDRTSKPRSSVTSETHETHVESRISSNSVDGGINSRQPSDKRMTHLQVRAVQSDVSGLKGNKKGAKAGYGSYKSAAKKPGPFGIAGKRKQDSRPQSTRGRITTQSQTKSILKMFEETGPPRHHDPSLTGVTRVDMNQSSMRTDRTDSVKNKDGSSQKKSGGGQIAVPFRGGSKHGEVNVNVNVVAPYQRSQSEKAPKHIKQTTVEKTRKVYRTETKVVDPVTGKALHSIENSSKPPPLDRSVSDSQVKVHMIAGAGGAPHNNAPFVTHKKETHVVKKEVINHVPGGEAQPSVVQLGRRLSGDLLMDSPPERRGSNHSVTNVSVTTHSTNGQTPIQVVRRASSDHVDGEIDSKRRGSSHSVRNMSVTSRTTEVQPSSQAVRRTSRDGVQVSLHGSNSPVKNVSVTKRTTEGKHVVRRSSGDLVNSAPLQSIVGGHSVGQQSNSNAMGVISVAHQGDSGWKRNLDDIPAPNSFGVSDQSSTDVRHYSEEKKLPQGYMKKEVYHTKTTKWATDKVSQ